jgi:Flp pilus assembly protein CpaB
MKLQRRIKRSTKQYIIVAFICIVVIGGAAAFTSFIITGQIREEYKALLKKAYDDLDMNRRNVYVAVTDIVSGDTVDADKVEKKAVFSSQPQTIFITEEELGKTALVGIPAGTQVLSTMLTDHSVSPKLR